MDLKVIEHEETPREDISLRSLRDKPKERQPELKAEKLELSDNIQKFDHKPRVYTKNPYDYNSISLRKREKPNVLPTQSATDMITNPTYNTIGKFLGIDTVHDWNNQYDKVYAITEWAKSKSGEKDINGLINWIGDQSRRVPNIGTKNLDNLYLFAKLYLTKK